MTSWKDEILISTQYLHNLLMAKIHPHRHFKILNGLKHNFKNIGTLGLEMDRIFTEYVSTMKDLKQHQIYCFIHCHSSSNEGALKCKSSPSEWLSLTLSHPASPLHNKSRMEMWVIWTVNHWRLMWKTSGINPKHNLCVIFTFTTRKYKTASL